MPARPRSEPRAGVRPQFARVLRRRLEVQADPRVGVGQARLAREPPGVQRVQPRALRLRERRVGRVADQRVAEAQPVRLRVRHEAALDEPHAGAPDLGARDTGRERRHGVGGEAVTDDRRERQRGAFGGLEPVEPRGEQRVQRGRERVRRALLLDVGDELLEEQRVAAGGRHDPAVLARGERGARHRRDQRPARLRRERRHHELFPARRTPARLIRARDPDEQDRRVAQAAEHGLEQVEQGGLRAVGVVDDEHERLRPGERAEQVPERPCRAAAGLRLLQSDGGRRPQHGRRRDREVRRELRPRARAARLQQRLAQRPERDALGRAPGSGRSAPCPGRRRARRRAATCRSRPRRAR